MKITVLIPVYNEAENIPALESQLSAANLPFGSEIIYIDDGSSDGSQAALQVVAARSSHVQVVTLRGNRGKSAALAEGFKRATGEVIVTMDADLQDDPRELEKLLKPLECFDMVAAWRFNRKENDPITKTLPSAVYNAIVTSMTGVPLHDMNCGYKAYRREAFASLRLYGELHRFIPVLLKQNGYTMTEVAVNHKPRVNGHSKFGHGRLLSGLLDFLTVLFVTNYLNQPMRVFGTLGLMSGFLGSAISFYMAALWTMGLGPVGTRPLFLVGIMLLLASLQFISMGFIGEMIRYYKEE